MAQPNPLFRPGGLVRSAQNALERRVQNNHQEMALQPSKKLASTVMMSLVGVTLFGIGWLAIALAMARPRWRLSLQTHKLLGLR